jgi:ferritin-like protein
MVTFQGMSDEDKLSDVRTLNKSLSFEHQGIWAYRVAAEKLTKSEVGKAVLALGLENLADHEKHRDLLSKAISDLGGTPVARETSYDLGPIIAEGHGNVDSDVNIAKLALTLEVGAAAGYVTDATQLKSPYLIELEAGIACVEAIHAARIRAAFNSLGIKMPVVANPVLAASTRDSWVLRV